MKTFLLTALIAIAAFINQSSAQFAYNFSKTTAAYTPLTAASSVTKGSLWNGDTTFVIPLGFNFKLAGVSISKIYFSAGNYATATNQSAKQSGFSMLGTGLMDRGSLSGISRSDIRYTTTGSAGSRIFKLEVFNAGFEDEYYNYEELKDSISLQLWLYEANNVVEFHYGSSMINNFSDYFGAALKSGYLLNMDTATLTFDKFYVVHGNATAPTLDSFTNFTSTKGLSNVPANGTVFRFAPKGGATGIRQVEAGSLAKIFPTQSTGTLNIEHNNSRPLDYAILNAQGQIIAKGTAATGRNVIDLNNIPSGVYFIQLMDSAHGIFEAQKFTRL